MKEVLEFIKLIRGSHTKMTAIFTEGSCYNFYLILKNKFPTAVAYYDSNHIITKIGDKFYDISGEVDGNDSEPFDSLYSPETRKKIITEILDYQYSIPDDLESLVVENVCDFYSFSEEYNWNHYDFFITGHLIKDGVKIPMALKSQVDHKTIHAGGYSQVKDNKSFQRIKLYNRFIQEAIMIKKHWVIHLKENEDKLA